MHLTLLHGGSEPESERPAVAPGGSVDDWLEDADAELRVRLCTKLASLTSAARDRAYANLAPIAAAGLRSEQDLVDALSPETPAALCVPVCGLIACLGGPEAATTGLYRLLREAPCASVRVQAAQAIARLGGREAHATLVGALTHDEDEEVRARAARALGTLRDQRAVPMLGVVLANPEETPAVRSEAAEALGLIGRRSVTPMLVRALSAEAPDVRAAAAGALGLTGRLEDLPALRALTGDHTMTPDLGPVSGCADAAIEDIRRRALATG
jgi:HEAT repeat protein